MNGLWLINQAYLIRRNHEVLCKPILQRYGLRQSELDVLLCLYANPECRTAGAVAELRMMPKSLVSASVDSLTQHGLLQGETDPADRRRVLLTILPEAQCVIDDAAQTCQQFLEQLCRHMTGSERDAMQHTLECLEQTIQQMQNP